MRLGGQREKGKAFERRVARILRCRWPHALVRRASQAERAHNPDVFAEGEPSLVRRLWLELQDSANPTPTQKLHQARRDVAADRRSYTLGQHRIPVAITHQLGCRTIIATIGIADLLDVLGPSSPRPSWDVSMPLDTLLEVVSTRTESEAV